MTGSISCYPQALHTRIIRTLEIRDEAWRIFSSPSFLLEVHTKRLCVLSSMWIACLDPYSKVENAASFAATPMDEASGLESAMLGCIRAMDNESSRELHSIFTRKRFFSGFHQHLRMAPSDGCGRAHSPPANVAMGGWAVSASVDTGVMGPHVQRWSPNEGARRSRGSWSKDAKTSIHLYFSCTAPRGRERPRLHVAFRRFFLSPAFRHLIFFVTFTKSVFTQRSEPMGAGMGLAQHSAADICRRTAC